MTNCKISVALSVVRNLERKRVSSSGMLKVSALTALNTLGFGAVNNNAWRLPTNRQLDGISFIFSSLMYASVIALNCSVYLFCVPFCKTVLSEQTVVN